MKQTLENKCLQHESARSQRLTELKAGLGLKGTEGYQTMGCYQCDGYNKECAAYLPRSQLTQNKQDSGITP